MPSPNLLPSFSSDFITKSEIVSPTSSRQVGEVDGGGEVKVRRQRLLTSAGGAEDHIPELGLLAVIGGLAVALAVVHVVVLDQQLGVDHPHQGSVGGWRAAENSGARVADELSEDDVGLAEPELVEAHGEAEEFHAGVGEERDDDDVENFLLVVGEEGKERCGVLGEVMGAVELPETVDLVHGAMVPVEPEVQADGVHANLGDDPPGEAEGLLARLVGEHDGEEWSEESGEDQRVDGGVDGCVGDLVAAVLFAVEEAILVAQVGQHVQDLHTGDVVGGCVQDEAPERRQVLAVVPAVDLLEDARPDAWVMTQRWVTQCGRYGIGSSFLKTGIGLPTLVG